MPPLDRTSGVARVVLDPPECAKVSSARGQVERLRREHGNVERLLLVLESHCARLHAGDDLDERLMLDAVSYLIDYVDRYHHTREDLVVELLAAREPVVQAMLATLSAQHDAIRSGGAALHEGLERALLGEPVAREGLARNGFAYSAELRRNMVFEELVLFPLAATAIDDSEWDAIDSKFAAGGDPLFGAEVDARYRALFEEITRRVGCDCSYALAG